MTPGFRRTARTRLGSSGSIRGRLGRSANCQIGVSVHAVGVRGTVPLGWALYLPEEWCKDPGRRRKAKIPDEVVFKTKVELGAELVERACGWAVPRAPVLGDHDYGRRGRLRERLDQAGCEYVLAVGPEPLGVRARHRLRATRPSVVRARKRPRPDRPPEPLGELIARLGQRSAQTVSFRDGPDGEPVTSTFIFTRVHVAHGTRVARIRPVPATPADHRRRAAPARGMADRRMARGRRASRSATGSQTSPPTPSPNGSPGSPACAGRSSSTTSSSKASSAWTTTKAAPGWAGITTPRWSPPPTGSSPSSGSTLFTRGRPDTREGRAAPAAALQVLDRPLPNLPPPHQHRPIDTHPGPPRRVRPNKALLRKLLSCGSNDSLMLVVRTGSDVGFHECGCSPTRARARCACGLSPIRPAASTPATPAIATKEGSRRGGSQRRSVDGLEMRLFGEYRGLIALQAETRSAGDAVPRPSAGRRR